jgi:3-hydroxyisobutyrate dehydrogenase
MKNVSFVGTGVMGAWLVRHLLKAGYSVTVFNRSMEKARALEREGAKVATSLKEVSSKADCVFTMVGFPQDVQSCYFGPDGILDNVREKTMLVDLTTSRPSLARQIEQAAKERNLFSLDCPVSGGDVGAKNATLALMVGGDQDAYERAMPILKNFGTPHFMGPAGESTRPKKSHCFKLIHPK